jgi:hypothetical protein
MYHGRRIVARIPLDLTSASPFAYSDIRVHHWSRMRNADVNEMVHAGMDRRGDSSFDRNEIHALELVRRSVLENRVSLELHQPLGINEPGDLHNRVCRTNPAEELSVHGRHRLPVFNMGQQRARPNHLVE